MRASPLSAVKAARKIRHQNSVALKNIPFDITLLPAHSCELYTPPCHHEHCPDQLVIIFARQDPPSQVYENQEHYKAYHNVNIYITIQRLYGH